MVSSAVKFFAGMACMLLAMSAARAADTPESLYEAAKKEGSVVYWSGNDVRTNRFIADAFTKKYPGIEVQLFKIQPGPAIDRIINESKAGRLTADLVDNGVAYLPQLSTRGLTEPYPWDKVFGIDKQDMVLDGQALNVIDLDMPIAYNTTMVKPGEIKSWDDLLDPKWKGKILVESRGVTFPILAQAWGADKTFDYLKKLLATKPIIIEGATPVMEALAGGQGAIAVGTYTGRVLEYQKKGAPVEWARVSPVPAWLYVVEVLKGSPHPAAAKLFTAFMLTKEGQAGLWEGQYFGRLKRPPLSPLGEEMQKDKLQVVSESANAEEMRALLVRTETIMRESK